MHRQILFLFLLLTTIANSIVSQSNVEFSLFTIAPGDSPANAFGHSAIRMIDRTKGIDKVYNYGIYDFAESGFLLKFLRGKLLYKVDVTPTGQFLSYYNHYKRSVREQVLQLNDKEKTNILNALNENMKKENRYYLYDFFYDNCATRIRDLFEQNIDGFAYTDTFTMYKTYRDLVDEYVEDRVWVDFGIDLILGAPTDVQADFRGQMFLPDYLHDNLMKASYFNGNTNSLFITKSEIIIDHPTKERHAWFTPLLFFLILLIIELILLFRNKNILKIFDKIWWIFLGVSSVVMMLMWFATDHQACGQNWNLLWANPFILLFAFQKWIPPTWNKSNKIIVLLCTAIALFSFVGLLPQRFHIAIIPIVILSIIKLLRSIFALKHP